MSARDPKCSAKDAEAGALAMEALHKQVSYFYDTFILVFCSITVLKQTARSGVCFDIGDVLNIFLYVA